MTNAEIEKDIVDALKNPPEQSEESYKSLENKESTSDIIIPICLVAIGFIYPISIPWILLGLIVFLIGYRLFDHFLLKNQIKNVTIDDYDITIDVVSSTDEEHYMVTIDSSVVRRCIDEVHNYIIHFENGKSWRVPKELYGGKDRLWMQDRGIYNSTHRGDTMITVTEKNTGNIVIAYNTNIFEYKNDVV